MSFFLLLPLCGAACTSPKLLRCKKKNNSSGRFTCKYTLICTATFKSTKSKNAWAWAHAFAVNWSQKLWYMCFLLIYLIVVGWWWWWWGRAGFSLPQAVSPWCTESLWSEQVPLVWPASRPVWMRAWCRRVLRAVMTWVGCGNSRQVHSSKRCTGHTPKDAPFTAHRKCMVTVANTCVVLMS